MSQLFNSVKVGNTSRSTFDLSHRQVTTSDFGYLIPICVRDMVPNDDFVVTPNVMCRMAPAAFPFYGKVTARIHHFYVPYRILYRKWSEFLVQSSSNNTIPPYITAATMRDLLDMDNQFSENAAPGQPRGLYGRVLANLGIDPTIICSQAIPDSQRFSAFRLMAYYRIWLDWYMDSNIYDHPNMVSAFNQAFENGGNVGSQWAARIMHYRCACFGKDYFTTAKVHPQAGSDPSVVNVSPGFDLATGTSSDATTSADDIVLGAYRDQFSGAVNVGNIQNLGGDQGEPYIGKFTVEDLRAAVSLQRYLERNNYVGSKVINQLLAHFGIAPTPERLDMSEFIGGSNLPLQVGDVTSHTPVSSHSVDTIGLGAQAGKGIIRGSSETVRYHAKEHGVFMTMLSILPDCGYYQGIPKEFTLGVTGDPLDYYTPEFENLGFQEILNSEVYVPDEETLVNSYQDYDPYGIFGYAPRYAFLKWQHDILAGDFVGNLAAQDSPVMGANMDAWHLFRKFIFTSQDPLALNENFVECDNHYNDFDRVFQVTDNQLDHFYFSIDVDVKATRPMVGFAEPTLDNVQSDDGNSINLPYGGTRL